MTLRSGALVQNVDRWETNFEQCESLAVEEVTMSGIFSTKFSVSEIDFDVC